MVKGAAVSTMRAAMGHPLTPGILLEQEVRREARKTVNRRRYVRRYARHAPPAARVRAPRPYTAEVAMSRVRQYQFEQMVKIGGFAAFLKDFAAKLFGNPKGKVETRGTWPSATRAGPGIRHTGARHPAGAKLVKRFVRDARGENVEYRRIHRKMTGRDTV